MWARIQRTPDLEGYERSYVSARCMAKGEASCVEGCVSEMMAITYCGNGHQQYCFNMGFCAKGDVCVYGVM